MYRIVNLLTGEYVRYSYATKQDKTRYQKRWNNRKKALKIVERLERREGKIAGEYAVVKCKK